MSPVTTSIPAAPEPSPEVFAEAAAWVARLHGPNRTMQSDRGFNRWLEADSTHASAFEAMTAAWEVTGNLPRQSFPHANRWKRAGHREGFVRSAVVVAALALLALGSILYLHKMGGVTTDVGEQRLLTLEDGTLVYLNTDTRDQSLIDWEQAPGGRDAQPHEDHLLPLMVAAGAASGEPAIVDFHGHVLGKPVSGFRFG